MRTLPAVPWTRRAFLGGLTLAATIGCLGPRPMPISAAQPPETTRIRLVHDPSICVTPQYLAEELLRADGFSEVQYVGDRRLWHQGDRRWRRGHDDGVRGHLPDPDRRGGPHRAARWRPHRLL